ncbi:MAG: SRPBCC family protein [Rhodospirillaceae bacterium]|nr:SRPBCC family protein [Rhodospirillaceae bacterium]
MDKDYRHAIVVERPVDQAFALFTPKGEEAWVPGWRPTYVRPASGETCRDMVFMTGEGAETTIWTCLCWQPEQWHVRYLRVTPNSRVAFVTVRCHPEGPARTRVAVTYEMVALSDDGRSFLAGLSEDEFARSIDAWSDMIAAMA